MSRKEKLLQKARNNPAGLCFADFVTLLRHAGWALDHQLGSHPVWYSSQGNRLSIQTRKGKAKAYQVKQFLSYYDE